MIITKEKFCEIIRKMQRMDEFIDKANELIRGLHDVVDIDFYQADIFCMGYKEIGVELLETMFPADDLSYFIYELDYGKKYKPGSITLDGKDLLMDSPESFYDTMVELSRKAERRVDDLGRVVITKYMREYMGIKEGDLLEEYAIYNKFIILKKGEDKNDKK